MTKNWRKSTLKNDAGFVQLPVAYFYPRVFPIFWSSSHISMEAVCCRTFCDSFASSFFSHPQYACLQTQMHVSRYLLNLQSPKCFSHPRRLLHRSITRPQAIPRACMLASSLARLPVLKFPPSHVLTALRKFSRTLIGPLDEEARAWSIARVEATLNALAAHTIARGETVSRAFDTPSRLVERAMPSSSELLCSALAQLLGDGKALTVGPVQT